MILQVVSIIGAVLTLGAYLAASSGWVEAKGPTFNGLNAVAAVFLLWAAIGLQNYGYILLNVAWLTLAVVALARFMIRAKSSKSDGKSES